MKQTICEDEPSEQQFYDCEGAAQVNMNRVQTLHRLEA